MKLDTALVLFGVMFIVMSMLASMAKDMNMPAAAWSVHSGAQLIAGSILILAGRRR